MPRPYSEALCLHLERARDWEGSSKLLGVPTFGGGWAWAGGGGGGGSQRSQIRPHTAQNVEKQRKNRQFRGHLGLIITKNAIFCSKVLNKIYFRDIY